jgi:hypothetical protein
MFLFIDLFDGITDNTPFKLNVGRRDKDHLEY